MSGNLMFKDKHLTPPLYMSATKDATATLFYFAKLSLAQQFINLRILKITRSYYALGGMLKRTLLMGDLSWNIGYIRQK